MARTVFQPADRGARGAWSDPSTKGGPLGDAPGAVIRQDGETDDGTTTSRHGHEVIASPAGNVVVDLADPDPPDAGCIVDLAQWESESSPTGRRTPDRIGAARRLSPSWPSVLRVTNAFGTTDLTDARERATP